MSGDWVFTALQVLGLVIAACGAWLAVGVGGVLIVIGLTLAFVSLMIEVGAQR